FFPLFPMLGHTVKLATGVETRDALLIVSFVSLGGAFVALRAYTRSRLPEAPDEDRDYVLLAFGLWPATFFFRMAYPEPLFILLAIVVLLSIERKWPVWAAALIAGLASAARPVGIALALPVAISAWRSGATVPSRLARVTIAVPLACWGLIGYMAYQHREYGDALQFIHAQSYWRVRPELPVPQRAVALLTGEPIRGLYDRSSSIYWRYKEEHRVMLFSFLAADVPLFVIVVAGVIVGWRRRWLNANELALSAALLLIPYVTRAYEMGMAGEGRFAAAVFPFYLVAGRVMCALPRATAAALLGTAGVFLMIYSSFVSAGFTLK
ncbi:MAG: hypothetical protein ACREHD_02855, partial [Pirellulales bacterium]